MRQRNIYVETRPNYPSHRGRESGLPDYSVGVSAHRAPRCRRVFAVVSGGRRADILGYPIGGTSNQAGCIDPPIFQNSNATRMKALPA